MNHASLFTGIGGFDLAASWMGWRNVFQCEIDKFCQRVLRYYFPNAIIYNDIRTTDFTAHRGNIDILTGGFPCQPFSMAGKRKGTEDDRHLWPEMLRAIREISPEWVVGENVGGLINWSGGLVFEQVQADLEAEGYEVQAFVLPACAVNAPHRRDRVWIVANATIKQNIRHGQGRLYAEFSGDGNLRPSPDTEKTECEPNSGTRERGERLANYDQEYDAPDTDLGQRPEGGMHPAGPGQTERHVGSCGSWVDERGNWHNFPTQPPVRRRDDGFSGQLDGITVSKLRNESIKAYGNAIVPQVSFEIFKAIESCKHNYL